MTSCLTSNRGADTELRGVLEDKPAFLPKEFMYIKYELHFYPFPLSRDVRNQFNCLDCQDSLGIMCIFSLSHRIHLSSE